VKSRWALAVVLTLVGAAVCAASVLATPGSGFSAAQQWKGVFGKIDVQTKVRTNDSRPHKVNIRTKGDSDVYVTRNEIAVGGHSGWHTHPGPSLIIVAVGEITAYDGDDPTCTPKRYQAGEGFVDPGDGHVHLLRNETDATAETVAVQILPKDATRRDDRPAPGNCPF
jgi:quercetin dioxygenase-like cupin family protein